MVRSCLPALVRFSMGTVSLGQLGVVRRASCAAEQALMSSVVSHGKFESARCACVRVCVCLNKLKFECSLILLVKPIIQPHVTLSRLHKSLDKTLSTSRAFVRNEINDLFRGET